MLMTDVWIALARAHAIEVAAPGTDDADVTLAGPGMPTTAYDVRSVTVLHPSRVRRFLGAPGAPRPLVIAARATGDALDAARAHGLSVLVAPDRGPVQGALVDSTGTWLAIDAPAPGTRPDPVPVVRPPGPAPWGSIALVVELLRDRRPRSQTALAAEVGVTQGRVSQVLGSMPFVRHDAGGWAVADTSAALDWLVARYRQPRTRSGWLSLDEPVGAARAVAALLERQHVRYAVTGQVAADVHAPWARPDRATIWTDRLIDLGDAGCTPAPESEATLVLAVPDDPLALDRADEDPGAPGMRLADAWRTWLALTQDGDAAAADHLRDRLLRA